MDGMDNAAPSFRRPGLTVIGLTGGMASGKSAVAVVLSETLGCERVDADQVCRELLQQGGPGWLAMAAEFGDQFFFGNQELDRVRLRKALFQDVVLRRRIDQLLHPLVKTAISARLAAIKIAAPFVVVEVPLLFEAGWQAEFDIIVVVTAEPEECLERLMRRDQIPKVEAKAALAAQWPLAEKVGRAHQVIDNSGAWPATREQILRLAEVLAGQTVGGGEKDLF